MNIYIKNTATNKILSFEVDKYESLSKNFRKEPYELVSDGEAESIILEKAVASKKEEVNAQRNAEMNKPHLFRKDGVDHYLSVDVLSWLNTIRRGDQLVWVTEDNVTVTLTISDANKICDHIRDRNTMEVRQGRARKDAIKLLDTVEEVEGYDITQAYEL